ncbi:hypothetical protein Brsp07_03012 [Brucella sp. NBRC 14130]|uniref:phage tail assembly chaperone n=1 Tax=Brucella sp. NBRC 14130 TaxID=3075483 RepID=UPI0030A6282B
MHDAAARLKMALVAALKRNLETKQAVHIPDAGRVLWQIYSDLAETRTWHMNGPNPISYEEIRSFCALQRWSLQPRHVAILRAMDGAYLEYVYSRQKKKDEGVKTIGKPTGDLSPALFDAVFR